MSSSRCLPSLSSCHPVRLRLPPFCHRPWFLHRLIHSLNEANTLSFSTMLSPSRSCTTSAFAPLSHRSISVPPLRPIDASPCQGCALPSLSSKSPVDPGSLSASWVAVKNHPEALMPSSSFTMMTPPVPYSSDHSPVRPPPRRPTPCPRAPNWHFGSHLHRSSSCSPMCPLYWVLRWATSFPSAQNEFLNSQLALAVGPSHLVTDRRRNPAATITVPGSLSLPSLPLAIGPPARDSWACVGWAG
jgi:hypothetical protein